MKLDFAALVRPVLPEPLPKPWGQVGTAGTPASARVAARSAPGDWLGTAGDKARSAAVGHATAGFAAVATAAACPQASPPCPQTGVAGTTNEINVSPSSPLVPSDFVQDVADTDDWREAFEERAAIMEFDGGMLRASAEVAAHAILTTHRQIGGFEHGTQETKG